MHDMFNYKWSVIFRTILFTKEIHMYMKHLHTYILIYIIFLPFYWMKIFLCHVMTLWINGALFRKKWVYAWWNVSPVSISGGNKVLSMKWKTNKQKTPHQLSYSKSVTNYEAFCCNISSSINSLFLKSGRE